MHKAMIGLESRPVFYGLALFQILAMFRRGIFYTFLAIYMRVYLGLSVTATSFYATLPALLSASFQMIVWGRLSDRRQNRRSFMIVGEIIPGLLLLVIFWLHHREANLTIAGYMLILGFSFIEIFWSMSNLGFTTIISDLYGPIRRNKVMNYLVAIGGISRMVGIYLSGVWYHDGWAFREGLFFYIASGVIFLSILPLFLLPKHVDPTRQLEEGTKIEVTRIEIPAKLAHPTIPFDRIFLILLIGLAIINLGRGGVGIVYPQFLILAAPGLAFNAARIALNTNIQSFAMVIAGLIMGKLGQRLGFTKLLFLGLVSGSLASLGTILFTHPGGIYLCSALLGASEVMIGTGAYVYASVLIPPAKRAQFFGIYNATFSIAGGVGASALIAPIIDSQLGPNSTPTTSLYAFQRGLGIAVGLMAVGMVILCMLEWRLLDLSHKRHLNQVE